MRDRREALQEWRDLGLAWDEAITAIDMATLLGPGEPDVVEAALVAEATFERLGAKRFLARLRTAMGGATAPAAPAASSASRNGEGAVDAGVAATSEQPTA